MTTLHRCPTPTNRLCPCGRVERELRKAGIEHETVRAPMRRRGREAILALTGQRAVPVLVFDGEEPIADSRRIVEHLRWRAAQAPGAERAPS